MTSQRTSTVLERLPGKLPRAQIADTVDLEREASSILEQFPRLGDEYFVDDALWRDSYGLTGMMRTFYGRELAVDTWKLLSRRREVSAAQLVQGSCRVMRVGSEHSWLECRFVFSAAGPATECSGYMSLVPSETGRWKIWLLRTVLEQLTGCGDVDQLQPVAAPTLGGEHATNNTEGLLSQPHPEPNGTDQYTAPTNGVSLNAEAQKTQISLPQNFYYAVVIGGSQSGLSTGGRLAALNVPYIILEKNNNVGDAWLLRYKSARRESQHSSVPDLLVLTLFVVHTIREYGMLQALRLKQVS
jgi:hypothetical protein